MTVTLHMPPETRASIEATLDLYGPSEARHALRMLEDGEVDGRSWCDPLNGCGCLIGSLAKGRLFEQGEPDPVWVLCQAPMHPAIAMATSSWAGFRDSEEAQDWFTFIRPGHTPANNDRARLAAEVMRSWTQANDPTMEVGNPARPVLPAITPEA